MNKKNNFLTSFFILGNPRSGTSLFRLMLNSHPNMIVPPESGFLQWWYNKYKDWNIDNSRDEKKVEKYVNDVLTSKKIEDWNLDQVGIIKEIIDNKPKNYGELSSIIYFCYNKSKLEIQLIGDKNNYYIHHLKLINSIYPKAKYIHLIRDGRDVACSYKKMNSMKSKSVYKPNLPFDLKEIAIEWNNNITKIDEFVKNKEHLIIKYEDLISNTESVLGMVCNFLGVKYAKTMLNFYEPNLNDEPKSTQDWKMKTFEPVDRKNKNKYLKLLNKKEIDDFNKISDKIFKKYGYE